MEATVLKVVISLKRLTPSLLVRIFPCWEKMVFLISPEIENLYTGTLISHFGSPCSSIEH